MAEALKAPEALQSRTETIVEFIVGTRTDSLSPGTIDAARRILLDTLACSIGAFVTPQGKVIADMKRDQGGKGEATLAVGGERLPAAAVAYVHAQLANILDADETFRDSLHFASAVVMPSIATAEIMGSSGAELLAAVAVGYEVAARVGSSLEAYQAGGQTVLLSPVRGFDWSALGAAAAVARLRGLDRRQTANALGIAFATTPVNYDIRRCTMPLFTPGQPAIWHKYGMYGAMAEAGYNAAILAEKGFQGDPGILDDDSGFWRSLGAPACNHEALTRDLGGENWAIAETSIKPYPFCRHGHRALDLFRSIVLDYGLEPADVDEVTVTIPPYETLQRIVENAWPDEPLKIMMSLRYAFWMLLTGVPTGPAWWEQRHLDDMEGRRFTERLKCVVEPEWRDIIADQVKATGLFPRYPVIVKVKGRKGAWERSAQYARGVNWPAEFRLSDEELAEKAEALTEPAIGAAQARALIAACDGLAKAPDVAALVQAFRTA